MEYEGLITDRIPLAVSTIQRRLSASRLKVEVGDSDHQRYRRTRFNRTPVPRRYQGTRLMGANQAGLMEISSDVAADNQLDSTPQPNASSVSGHDDRVTTTSAKVRHSVMSRCTRT